MSPLWEALYRLPSQKNVDGMAIVKYLIEKGADVNFSCPDVFRCSNISSEDIAASCIDLVIYNTGSKAISDSCNSLFEVLYNKGAKLSKYSLAWAVLANNYNIAKTLVESGRLPKGAMDVGLVLIPENIGNPFLSDFDAKAFFELLLDNGADVNYKDLGGFTVLQKVFRHNEEVDVFKFLIDKGADVNTVNTSGQSLLVSINYDDIEEKYFQDKIEIIFATNYNVNLVSRYGESAFDWLLCSDYSRGWGGKPSEHRIELFHKLERRFIEAGLNVNDKRIATPYIITAAKNNKLDAAIMLIENGADTKVVDADGKNALYYAYDTDNKALIEALKNPQAILDKKAARDEAEHQLKIKAEEVLPLLTQKKFVEMERVISQHNIPAAYLYSDGETLQKKMEDALDKNNDVYLACLLAKITDFSNVLVNFDEKKPAWVFEICNYAITITSLDDIPLEDVKDFILKGADAYFANCLQNIKKHNYSTTPLNCRSLKTNDSLLMGLIKEGDKKSALSLLNGDFDIDLGVVNVDGLTAYDLATKTKLKAVAKAIKKRL